MKALLAGDSRSVPGIAAFSQRQFDVFTATSQALCHAAYDEMPIDIVIVFAPGPVCPRALLTHMTRRRFAPVIVVGDFDDDEHIALQEHGVDRCLPQSVHADVLAAHAAAVLREAGVQILRQRDIICDVVRRCVTVSGKVVRLREKEHRILAVLMARGGESVTTEELRRLVWPGDRAVTHHTVQVTVSRLQRQLVADEQYKYIRSSKGRYWFAPA